MEYNFNSLKQNLLTIKSLGQSIWIDNLSREGLQNNELQKLVDSGIRGLTTNPSIFKNSISSSELYSKDITELAKKGLNSESICDELFIKDVSAACDMLSGVYTESKATDGYVSIEVSPLLAKDTDKTVESGKNLWNKINKKNLMVKVPATPEGILAVKELLIAGINVNVTLIFSVKVYADVIESYISALEFRKSKGLDISQVSSVASFFVSRVDALVESKLKEMGVIDKYKSLIGKIGIANCVEAYNLFNEAFNSERFNKLKSTDKANPQRALWASTGVKNKDFNPLTYITNLLAPQTVNTVPPATLAEIANSNQLNEKTYSSLLDKNFDVKAIFSELKNSGINFESVLSELQIDGVKIFEDAYLSLLKSVNDKYLKQGV